MSLEIVDEDGVRWSIPHSSIGHPRDGYRLELRPALVRGLDEFEYRHAHSDGWTQCRVLYRRGRYLIVHDSQPSPTTLPPRSVWCIHEYYHTGLRLYVRSEDGSLTGVMTLDDLEAAIGGSSPEVIAAAVEGGRLFPEAIGPRFGLATTDSGS